MMGNGGKTTIFLIGDNRRLIPMGSDAILISAAPELYGSFLELHQLLFTALIGKAMTDAQREALDRAVVLRNRIDGSAVRS